LCSLPVLVVSATQLLLFIHSTYHQFCSSATSAATAIVRRIQRYLMANIKRAEAATSPQSEAVPAAVLSFFIFSARWLRSRLFFSPIFGY